MGNVDGKVVMEQNCVKIQIRSVRKVFGRSLPGGYCSAGCYTAHNFVGSTAAVDKDDELRTKAGDIFDKLYEHGFIEDVIAISPERFAEAVELMLPILKEKGE